jgi:hypothetical protein
MDWLLHLHPVVTIPYLLKRFGLLNGVSLLGMAIAFVKMNDLEKLGVIFISALIGDSIIFWSEGLFRLVLASLGL